MELLIQLLIFLCIISVFFYVVNILLANLPIPARNVANVIIALVALVWLINLFGYHPLNWHR